MKISDLRKALEEVEEEYGDYDVSATCDGWLPPAVQLNVQPERDLLVLYGRRQADGQITEEEYVPL
jgi:hypothetical protein